MTFTLTLDDFIDAWWDWHRVKFPNAFENWYTADYEEFPYIEWSNLYGEGVEQVSFSL